MKEEQKPDVDADSTPSANSANTSTESEKPTIDLASQVVAASQAGTDDGSRQRDPLPWLIQRLRQQARA